MTKQQKLEFISEWAEKTPMSPQLVNTLIELFMTDSIEEFADGFDRDIKPFYDEIIEELEKLEKRKSIADNFFIDFSKLDSKRKTEKETNMTKSPITTTDELASILGEQMKSEQPTLVKTVIKELSKEPSPKNEIREWGKKVSESFGKGVNNGKTTNEINLKSEPSRKNRFTFELEDAPELTNQVHSIEFKGKKKQFTVTYLCMPSTMTIKDFICNTFNGEKKLGPVNEKIGQATLKILSPTGDPQAEFNIGKITLKGISTDLNSQSEALMTYTLHFTYKTIS